MNGFNKIQGTGLAILSLLLISCAPRTHVKKVVEYQYDVVEQRTITELQTITEMCTVVDTDMGATITCPDGSETTILDGAVGATGASGIDGQDGEDSPISPYSLTEVVNPCGDTSGIEDEILLRTASGELVASFSQNWNGDNTRLSLLGPGSYMTTDGDSCYFTIDENLDIINEHH